MVSESEALRITRSTISRARAAVAGISPLDHTDALRELNKTIDTVNTLASGKPAYFPKDKDLLVATGMLYLLRYQTREKIHRQPKGIDSVLDLERYALCCDLISKLDKIPEDTRKVSVEKRDKTLLGIRGVIRTVKASATSAEKACIDAISVDYADLRKPKDILAYLINKWGIEA